MPDERLYISGYETNDVMELNKEDIRAEMWWELARKNIFEDFMEIKKTQVQDCIQHKRYSKTFENTPGTLFLNINVVTELLEFLICLMLFCLTGIESKWMKIMNYLKKKSFMH